MAKNIQNVRIGEVDIYEDDGSGEVLVGHTKGGVLFTFERTFEDLTVDQYGTTPIDMALQGHNLVIEANYAEPTTENMARAIPEGAYAPGVNGDAKLGLGRDSGYLLRDDAVLLRLHPRHNDADNRNEDIYIWLAVSSDNVELPYKVDEQRILTVKYRALVDEDQPDGYRLGRVGDADIS